MASTMSFGKGATIGFYIEGNSEIDLTTQEFWVCFYTNPSNKVYLHKYGNDEGDFTRISGENKYYGYISNTVTAALPEGMYIEEVMVGDVYTIVARGNAFYLFDTEIKEKVE